MQDNRRQSERINIPLEIVLESASGKRECRISDLSSGGCFVDSIANVSNGENITLMVQMPAGHWLKLSGEVVYLYPSFGFGLRFVDLSKEERVLLEQVIRAHSGKPFHQAETGTPIVEEVSGRADSSINTGGISNEFEHFIQDLFDNLDDESKPVQARKDSSR